MLDISTFFIIRKNIPKKFYIVKYFEERNIKYKMYIIDRLLKNKNDGDLSRIEISKKDFKMLKKYFKAKTYRGHLFLSPEQYNKYKNDELAYIDFKIINEDDIEVELNKSPFNKLRKL